LNLTNEILSNKSEIKNPIQFSKKNFFVEKNAVDDCNLIIDKIAEGEIILQYFIQPSACEQLMMEASQQQIEKSNKHKLFVFEFKIFNLPTTEFIFNRLNEILSTKNKMERIYCTDTQMIIYQIAQSKLEGEWFNLWLMGKAAELVTCIHSCMALEQSETLNNNWLKEDDKIKIAEAKSILLNQLHEAVPIKTLSKRVGINENYLKRGFKEMYGTTIYQCFQEERMKHAAHVLKTQQSSVKDVAINLGYANMSHFSTAFKKVVGLNPCELIK
jgi:AraC-like DNA-binding protein